MKQIVKISYLKHAIVFTLVCFISLTLAQDQKKAAPSFKVRDLKGKLVTSEKLYSAGPSIVFFWHSCCGLNKNQLQTLKDFHSKYKEKGFEVVGIALDGVSKTAKVKKAVSVCKMPWINVVDKNNTIKDKFNPTAVPAMFIIEKGGTIIGTFNGYETGDEKKLGSMVTPLIAG